MKGNKAEILSCSAALLVTVMLISFSPVAEGVTSPVESLTAQSAPDELTIFTTYFGPAAPADDNIVKREIEQRTHTKLTITWAGTGANEKANVLLSSGAIPDLMLISDITNPRFTELVNQGLFWNLTPLIKRYPNLMKFPEDTWINTRINGKTYGIPRVRPTEGGSFPYVRKDWLDKLGLAVPLTMDDVYQVWKAFAERDPDGNGKPDTFGMAGHAGIFSMNTLAWVENIYNRAYGEYAMVDGKLISKTLLPGTRRALLLLNRAYREKLIPPDFAVLTANQAIGMLQTNKAGMYYGPPESAWPDVEALRRTVPEADMLPLVSIDGVTFRDPGFFGMYAIPKTVSEAKLHQILAFMDYGASEEGSLLGNYGLRNVHFKEADGMKVTTEQAKKDAVSAQTFGQIFQSYDKYFRAFRTGMDKAVFLRNKSIIDERARISIPDYAKGLYSETNEKRGAAFTKTIIDMKIKVIMGREPISSWDSLVERLKNDPDFAAIDSELNEAYLIRTGEQR